MDPEPRGRGRRCARDDDAPGFTEDDMGKRVCAEPGCPALIDRTARDGRCDQHRRARDKARGTRQQRGYDNQHDQLRAHYQRRMDNGERFTCWRCTRPIDPQAWHLGHDDEDRTHYRGPECPPCNLAAPHRRPKG